MLRALATMAVRPLGTALALPGAVIGGVAGLARAARDAEVAAVHALALAQRAELLLDAVEPPARRLAAELDDDLIADLSRSARALPAVLALALDAVTRFEVFVGNAERARDGAEALVHDVSELTVRARTMLTQVEEVLIETARTVDGAGAVVMTAEHVSGRVGELVAAADTAIEAASATAAMAAGLTERARPVVELAVGLGEQAAGPAGVLLPVVTSQAPRVADLAPALIDALRDLLANLPEVLRRVDEELMPTLDELRGTPADVRALRDSVEEIEPLMGEVEAELAGLPGSRVLRRRGRRSEKDPDPQV